MVPPSDQVTRYRCRLLRGKLRNQELHTLGRYLHHRFSRGTYTSIIYPEVKVRRGMSERAAHRIIVTALHQLRQNPWDVVDGSPGPFAASRICADVAPHLVAPPKGRHSTNAR